MGILGRRRTTALVATAPQTCWRPESDGVLLRPGIDMDDEDCAGNGYGAQFYTDSAPGASLTVWVYPIYTMGQEFILRYRCECDTRQDSWVGGLWTSSHLSYGSIPSAERAACTDAQALNELGPGVAIEDVAVFFSWNGRAI